MTAIGAFISGCAGTALSEQETAFFQRTNPFGLILFLSTGQSTLQLGVPDGIRGRVMALWAITLSAQGTRTPASMKPSPGSRRWMS